MVVEASPEEDDAAQSGASLQARTLVYTFGCLGVQMCLSYGGGAVPASLDTLQKAGIDLSATDLGVLGALDKVGQTVASLCWGRALQLQRSKPLLVLGVATAAASALIFGLVRQRYILFAGQFCYGVSQALQIVWGTVWTLQNAPAEKRAQWMSFGAVFAGLGNCIGTAVAGFCTANNVPYSVAFIVQASMLAVLCVVLACTPAEILDISAVSAPGVESKSYEALEAAAPLESAGKAPGGVRQQLAVLWGNSLYILTGLCMSQLYFVITGTQFLWMRVFVNGAWALNKNIAVTSLLIIVGLGVVGVTQGARLIDKYGGFGDDDSRYRTLLILGRFAIVAACAAIVGAAFVSWKTFGSVPYIDGQDPSLWLLWVSVGVVFMSYSASMASYALMNCETVPKEMRSFASGITVSAQNLLGYAGGSLWPGLIMDLSSAIYAMACKGGVFPVASQLTSSFLYVNCFSVSLVITVYVAVSIASERVGLKALNVEAC